MTRRSLGLSNVWRLFSSLLASLSLTLELSHRDFLSHYGTSSFRVVGENLDQPYVQRLSFEFLWKKCCGNWQLGKDMIARDKSEKKKKMFAINVLRICTGDHSIMLQFNNLVILAQSAWTLVAKFHCNVSAILRKNK